MPFLCPGPLLTKPCPVEYSVHSSRNMLLANGTFMDLLDRTGFPSLVMTLDHQVILANQAMLDKLGLADDATLLGSVTGAISCCPAGEEMKTRTWSIEVQERVFLIMNLECGSTANCLESSRPNT